jgi:hypothetical protein
MPTQYDDQEPAYRCTCCTRLLHADELTRYACRVCEDQAVKQLRELATLYGRLADVLVPGAAPSNGGRVVTSKSAPLPAALTPLDLRGPGGIVSVLVGIEIRWLTAVGFTLPGFRGSYEQELPQAVKVLVNQLPWACDAFEDVADGLRKISSLHGRATAAVTGERDVRVPLGTCPTVVDETTGEVCGSKLRVSPWAAVIRCGLCNTQWGRDEWLRLGSAMCGLPVPAYTAARVVA